MRQNHDAELDILMYEDQTHSIQLDAPQRLIADMTRWLRAHSPQ